MRKSLLTSLLLLLCTMLSAGNISQKEALKKAASLFDQYTSLKLVATASGDQPAYYVFNAQRAEKGFVIVAGESLDDDILGYSDHGEFNPKSMPPALQYMLLCYEEQINMLRSGQASAYKAPARDAIEPLTQTMWGQDAPYNNMVPLLPESDSDAQERCATGCVATAMAQILKYWSYDRATTRIPQYTTKTNSIYMPSLEPTTFDYSIMENQYNTTEGEAANAVAKLMLYCGQAAQMDYDEESSAVVRSAYFSTYFGFNANCRDEYRANYRADVWDQIMYDELQAKRPVLYAGANFTDGGHAFLLDGYKDGYYHINWGWYGYCDGYFKLSEVDPEKGGIGAGVGLDGYSFAQTAAIGIQPETATIKTYTKANGNQESLKVNSASIEGRKKTGATITVKANVTNNGRVNVSSLYLIAGDSLVTGVGAHIDPNNTDDVLLHFSLEEAGTYALKLCTDKYGSKVLWTGSVDITLSRTPNLEGSNIHIDNCTEYDNSNVWPVAGNVFKYGIDLTNNDIEDFEAPLRAILFKMVRNGNGFTSSSYSIKMQTVAIEAGKTERVEFEFDNMETDCYYIMRLDVYDYSTHAFSELESGYQYLNFLGKIYSVIYQSVEAPSGIHGVTMDGADGQTTIYDLNGRRVGTLGDQLPKGLYIAKGKKFVVK